MKPELRAAILRALEDDEDFYRELCSQSLLPTDDDALSPEHVELARVTRTLVRELEVNWAGVEIVLRMRQELIDARRQVAALLEVLEPRRGAPHMTPTDEL